MGLDQYAFAVKPSKEDTPFSFANHDKTEIAYWRKHPNLQGWMERLWLEKREQAGDPVQPATEGWFAGEIVFNCEYVELTPADLDALEQAVNGEELPETEGFFFGGNSDDHYREQDLEFIAEARRAIGGDYRVYYTSWW